MADDELKRLLEGLFSDIPIEVAPGEAPPDEPPLAYGRDRQGEVPELRDAHELERLAARFQAAARLSRAASSILTLDELLPQVVDLIRKEFDYYYVGIFLVDPDHKWAVLQAGTGDAGRQMVAEGHKLKVGGRSMIGWCVANAQARIALDVGEDAIRFDNPLLPETRSEMALPLLSRGRILGAMTIQSTQPAAFAQEDVTILQTMADQLANAIENARLFQERERRITELSVINDIGQALSSALELDELLEIVHLQVSRLFDTANFYIATYEAGSDQWTSAFHLEQGQRQPRARYSIEAGLTGYIIRSRQHLLFRSIEENIAFCQAQGVRVIGEMARSWLGVPLIAADKLVGVMAIQNYAHESLYSEQDLTLFSTIGSAVANALENLRLLEETRRRAREMEAINDVGRTITSVLDLEQVLRQIVDIAKDRFGHHFVGISLVEDDQLVFQCGSTIGDSQTRLEVGKVIIDAVRNGEHGPSLIAQAVRTGQPVLSHDVLSDPRYLPIAGLEATRSELDVPIEVKGRIIGALDIQSDRPFAFDHTDVALLQSLASQAGVAIDNARLFKETEEALAETETLYNASRLLTTAGSLQEIVAAVAEGVYVPAINRAILWDVECDAEDEVEAFVALANWYSGEGTPPLPLGTRFPTAEFPATDLMLTTEPLLFEDIQQDNQIDPVTRAVFEHQNARVVALLPLWPGGGRRQTGTLMLLGEKLHRFTDAEIRSYRSLAGQMAIIIENRRLLEETQQAARKLEEERALLRTTIDNLPDYIYVKDRQSRFVINNLAHLRVLGAETQDQVIGKTDFDIFPHELASRYYADEQELMQTEQPLLDREEPVIDQTTGDRLWVTTTKVPLWDAHGEVYGFVGLTRDITSRKQAEGVLERRSSQLQCLSDIGQAIGESPPVAEFLKWVTERIPSAMQFPDLCVVAIEFQGTVYGNAEAVRLPCQIVQSLISGDERAGRVYIAYTEARDFLDEESALLGDITRRVSGYLESRRLLEQTRAALAEVEATQRSYLRRSWHDHLRQREMLQRSGFLYDASAGAEHSSALTPAPDIWRPEMERALLEGSPGIIEDGGAPDALGEGDGLTAPGRAGLAVPVTLRGETIGVLGVEAPGGGRQWTEDDIALIQAVGDQLGQTLETARLFADTQRRAERERLISEITTKIRASTDMRDILETAAVELGQALGTSRAFVRVGIEELGPQQRSETRPSTELAEGLQTHSEPDNGRG